MLSLYTPSPQKYNVNKLLVDMGIYFGNIHIDNFEKNLYYKLYKRYLPNILNGEICFRHNKREPVLKETAFEKGTT
jgi:hypothetical protein